MFYHLVKHETTQAHECTDNDIGYNSVEIRPEISPSDMPDFAEIGNHLSLPPEKIKDSNYLRWSTEGICLPG